MKNKTAIIYFGAANLCLGFAIIKKNKKEQESNLENEQNSTEKTE